MITQNYEEEYVALKCEPHYGSAPFLLALLAEVGYKYGVAISPASSLGLHVSKVLPSDAYLQGVAIWHRAGRAVWQRDDLPWLAPFNTPPRVDPTRYPVPVDWSVPWQSTVADKIRDSRRAFEEMRVGVLTMRWRSLILRLAMKLDFTCFDWEEFVQKCLLVGQYEVRDFPEFFAPRQFIPLRGWAALYRSGNLSPTPSERDVDDVSTAYQSVELEDVDVQELD